MLNATIDRGEAFTPPAAKDVREKMSGESFFANIFCRRLYRCRAVCTLLHDLCSRTWCAVAYRTAATLIAPPLTSPFPDPDPWTFKPAYAIARGLKASQAYSNAFLHLHSDWPMGQSGWRRPAVFRGQWWHVGLQTEMEMGHLSWPMTNGHYILRMWLRGALHGGI